MIMRSVIEEIKKFVDNHEKTDSPLFVYYEPMKTDKGGKVLENTRFLTTTDELVAMKSNNQYVTFYGREYESNINIEVWLRGIVPPSEIDDI